MMNLQVQVTASLCLVLMVIQPALNQRVDPFTQFSFDESEPDVANIRYVQQRWPLRQPTKSYKQISYGESERERKRANIHIVQRETIKKSPASDCDVKISELPTVTFQHPTSIQQIGEPLIVSQRPTLRQPQLLADDGELPASLRQEQVQIGDSIAEENLLRRLMYAKYGKDIVFVGPRSRQPVSRRPSLRLPQLSRDDVDILLAADPQLRRIQVNTNANDEEVVLALYPQLRGNTQSNTKREEFLDLLKAANITPQQYRDLIDGTAFINRRVPRLLDTPARTRSEAQYYE